MKKKPWLGQPVENLGNREMIGIINYGLGNLNSIRNMLKKINVVSEIVADPSKFRDFEKLILPGVGAFDHGMRGLRENTMIPALEEEVLGKGKLILGICLGMQLICKGSEEGQSPGLGWIDCHFTKFRFPEGSPLKVPHMGWNLVHVLRDNPLFPRKAGEEDRFYFVHSYHGCCANEEDVVAVANHGGPVLAAVRRGNIFGVQFHPEKSHRFGMELLRRFAEI
jgi:glutamine amidotransferase